MTTDEQALLAAICANPAEDVPRLMYADEIQETQPERAEFIRVQVELPKLKPRPVFECRIVSHCPEGNRLRGSAIIQSSWESVPQRGDVVDLLHRGPSHEVQVIGAAVLDVTFHYAPDPRPARCELKFLATGEPCRDRERADALLIRQRELWPKQMVLWGTEVGDYHRGFLRTWQGIAADFLTHADALVWRPEMTDECDTWNGFELTQGGSRIPRPCPPTAQPIEHVTLTTLPLLKYEFAGGDIPRFAHLPGRADKKVRVYHDPWSVASQERDAREVMEAMFPGIKFKVEASIPSGTGGRLFVDGYETPIRSWSMRSAGPVVDPRATIRPDSV